MNVSPQEHQRVADAIARAEEKTQAEIVVVLAQSSSTYADYWLGAAALLALATPLPLIWFTQLSAQRIYLAELLVFLAFVAAFLYLPLRVRLAPRGERLARARRAANDQFVVRSVSRTRGRTGVLLYVSAAERCAFVLPDVAIADRIPHAAWQEAIDRLCAAARRGALIEGCVAAVEACGAALAAEFPRAPGDGDEDERPNELHVI
jgi:putative membrane protein